MDQDQAPDDLGHPTDHDPGAEDPAGRDDARPTDVGADPEPVVEPGVRVGVEPVRPIGRPRGVGRSGAVRLALAGVAIMAGAALFLSGYSLGARTATTPGTPAGLDRLWAPFWDTYHSITERYAGGPVDQPKLVEGAIKGMVDSLGDPYSAYYAPADYKATLQGISGQFEGIGAEVGTRAVVGAGGGTGGDATGGTGAPAGCSTLGPTCALVVIAPIDGSPALRAGVRAGDAITLIDGAPVAGSTLDEAVRRIRGPKGTTVTLTLVREGAAPFDLPIVRDVIVQKEVSTRTLAGGTVGYVRVTGFSDAAAADVARAVRADVEAGRKRLVVDLRGNPGGFITAARAVASQFIASGPIYWTEDAAGTDVATDAEAGGAATDPSIRVVVLIDRGSASASEIVAGALQDTRRGTLVGETSFGKGTVQQWQPLENDAGGFKLTIARWLTPAKRWINHTGLTPDVAVTTPAGTPADRDPALERALLVLGG